MSADTAIKEPCRIATTGNIALSGFQTIDGITLVANDRVLVRAQSSAIQNGIYVVASGSWPRAADFDGTGEAVGGTLVSVTSGTAYAGSSWRITGAGTRTIGTNTIDFERAYDSSSVTFRQIGTGAIERSVRDRLRDSSSVADFGATGNDGVQTPSIQAAYDAAIAGSTNYEGGGTLFFPEGKYRLALSMSRRTVNINGDGRLSSILRPATAAGVVLQADFNYAGWDGPTISNVGFAGIDTLAGIGYRTGGATWSTSAEYISGNTFDRCHFSNLDKAIVRPFGNIGLWITDGTFDSCNYHLHTVANTGANGDPMHPGNMIVTRGHMQGAGKASVYIDGQNVTGAGQVVFDNVIQEANPGWVFYVKNWNNRGGIPTGVVRNCWNESNYTSPSVNVEGDTGAPGYAKFDNVSLWLFENTPVGPLVLQNASSVVTRDCDLSLLTSLSMDSTSSLVHENARMFSGTTFGLVESIGSLDNTSATTLNTPWFTMPRPRGLIRLPNAQQVLVSNAQSVESWSGTASVSSSTVTTDPCLGTLANVQDITISAGQNLFPLPAFTLPGSKWIVVQHLVKLLSGNPVQFLINGTSGRMGLGTIRNTDYRTITGVVFNPGSDVANEWLYHSGPTSGSTVVRYGGYAITAWDSKQEALAYANSGMFPIKP